MIREATHADVPRIVEMGARFAGETQYSRLIEIDPERVRALVKDVLASPEGVVFLSDRAGKVDGFIALAIAPHPYSGERTAFEMVWWVDPEARGAGIRLLDVAEKWARGHGVACIQMVAPVGSGIGKVYNRRGYSELESSWSRRF